MVRATITLNRCESISCSASCTVLCVTLRSATSPPSGEVPGADVTSPLSRHARCRNFSDPPGDTSAQSMSSSGGPANTIVSRTASTPYCVDHVAQVDAVAQRLAHPAALVDDLALVQQRRERLDEVDHPHVVQHLGEEPAVQQVQDRVLDAADVLLGGHPAAHRLLVERAVLVVRRAVAQEVPRRVDERVHRVGVALSALPPQLGQSTLTQSSAAASGEVPFGFRSAPRRSGSTTGSWSSGTGTSPHDGQCTIGIGQPQNRCRDSSQSRSRKLTAPVPVPGASR